MAKVHWRSRRKSLSSVMGQCYDTGHDRTQGHPVPPLPNARASRSDGADRRGMPVRLQLALEQRRDWYRPGRKFTFASQCREVTQVRAKVDWLKAVPVHALQQALRDLDRACQNFFAGRAA